MSLINTERASLSASLSLSLSRSSPRHFFVHLHALAPLYITTPPMFLSLLENTCNHMLADDAQALRALESIEGKCVQLRLHGALRDVGPVFIHVQDARLQLSSEAPEKIAATIEATPDALITALSVAHGTTHDVANDGAVHDDALQNNFSAHGIELSGDLEAVRHLSVALAHCCDWEEQLAKLIGDAAARKIGWGGRAMTSLLHRARSEALADLGWYLKDDANLVVRREQVREFGESVTALRDAVRDLERRIQPLEKSS